ncbi:MAG: carbamoyl phosphate synthase small subunit, partial [Firmicutes bacterium]|nr:carbamoyl phosphate synthase small subunit [Bacillota bacterium]
MKAYLILQDGSYFLGKQIGKKGQSVGELVYTTAMNGYMETLTDPSFFGQIIMPTFPMIGNYGSITVDNECDRSWVFGYVVSELCKNGSNFRMQSELNDFLVAQGIVGIEGVDVRHIAKKIRASGTINAMICDNIDNLDEKLKQIKQFKIVDPIKNISSKQVAVFKSQVKGDKLNIGVYDFGSKQSIVNELLNRGCDVTVIPFDHTAEMIEKLNLDGIVLSNGAGDP